MFMGGARAVTYSTDPLIHIACFVSLSSVRAHDNDYLRVTIWETAQETRR